MVKQIHFLIYQHNLETAVAWITLKIMLYPQINRLHFPKNITTISLVYCGVFCLFICFCFFVCFFGFFLELCYSIIKRQNVCTFLLQYGKSDKMWFLKLNHNITFPVSRDAPFWNPASKLWGSLAATGGVPLRALSWGPHLELPSNHQTGEWVSVQIIPKGNPAALWASLGDATQQAFPLICAESVDPRCNKRLSLP